jgi:hypothetical protein
MADRIGPGEYADTLRALGQFFGKTGASRIEILSQEDRWVVASTRGSETVFARYALNELRRDSQLRRGTSEEDDAGLGEVLRVIGQILDGLEASTFMVCQVPEGFRVNATCQTGNTDRTYALDEIQALTAAHRRARGGGSAEAPSDVPGQA